MSIISISGRMGSGKNTVGDIIEKLCLTNNGPKFEQKSFAGKLKQIASLLTGFDVEKFEDQEFKKNLLDSEWGTVQQIPLNSISPFANMEFNVLITVREFLQKLGTEAMRDGLHVNTWINALFADYRAEESWMNVQLTEKPELLYPNWIITDMRFPNEMEAVEKRGGITIRITRPVKKSKTTARLHPSETSLDKAKFDYEIINDSTIEELVKKVREILIKENII